MLVRVWRRGNPLTLLVGMQTGMANYGEQCGDSLKTGNRTAIWPSNPTAGHTHWEHQNWKGHMYPNVHHSTVYNSQNMEATLVSIGRRMDKKLCYMYTMEYYSAIKKNSCESVLMRWMKLEPIIQSEGSQKDKQQYSILTRIIWNLERWQR